jgi:hypothetical protein
VKRKTNRGAPKRVLLAGALAASALLPATAVAADGNAAGGKPASGLGSYLIQKGEETGFAPKQKPRVATSLDQLLERDYREKGRALEKEAARLESEGWEEAAYELLKPTSGAKGEGLSSVLAFATPEGAKAELRFEFKRDTAKVPKGQRLEPLKVPAVPGAKAFELSSAKKEGGAANALFVEGSCMFVVGDFKESGRGVAAPVIAGVEAIYKRTNGECS